MVNQNKLKNINGPSGSSNECFLNSEIQLISDCSFCLKRAKTKQTWLT